MYAVETSKMSSKGQLVIPDAFRKSYGWKAGMTLLLIGTADAVVLQPLRTPNESSVDKILSEAKALGEDVADRVKRAEASLAKLGRLGIVLPDGFEKGEGRRASLRERHS